MAVKVVLDTNRTRSEQESDNLQIAQEHFEINGPMEYAWAEILKHNGNALSVLKKKEKEKVLRYVRR